MNYIEIKFKIDQVAEYFDILQSDLCDIGFESFQDVEDGFLAYCPEKDFSQEELDNLIQVFLENNPSVEIETEEKLIEDQNWNEEWEKSYPAVLIDDYCYVHAPFHDKIQDIQFNIEITPKMSFGTAHHPTTFQIISLLKEEDLTNKDVMDMGSGTGVLAILSKLKGANYVEAIDNDTWAYENAKENVECNMVDITVRLGDAGSLDRKYDVFIANINRNILLRDIKIYSNYTLDNGLLILSGFYTEDNDLIIKEANKYGFELIEAISKENWSALKLKKI